MLTVNQLGRAGLWMTARKHVKTQDPQLWANYIRVITRDITADPTKSVGENVVEALEKASADYTDDQWGYKRKNGKKVTFQKIVEEILESLGAVDSIGAAVASLDPFHVAGVRWAGIQFFVKVCFPARSCSELITECSGLCQ